MLLHAAAPNTVQKLCRGLQNVSVHPECEVLLQRLHAITLEGRQEDSDTARGESFLALHLAFENGMKRCNPLLAMLTMVVFFYPLFSR